MGRHTCSWEVAGLEAGQPWCAGWQRLCTSTVWVLLTCATHAHTHPCIVVDGVVYVVDSGVVKQKEYNPRTGMDSLGVTPISRCGFC